jgi:hypothetical protein
MPTVIELIVKTQPGMKADPDHRGHSYGLGGEEEKAPAAGCDEYVPKSYSPLAIAATLLSISPGTLAVSL